MVLDRFRYGTRWHDWSNRRRYDTPADPWKPIRVDPTDVERYNVVTLKYGLGAVIGGEWDRPENCTRLDETYIHEGLRQRFEEGRDWSETRYCEWARAQFEDGDSVRGCSTIEAFREERCVALDGLYEEMRTDGYSPNYERLYDTPADIEYVHDMEPMVLVGRDGELLWTEGFHRHALAELAGIDEVPVYVLRRHVEWQRTREALHRTDPAERSTRLAAHAAHPDVQDVVD